WCKVIVVVHIDRCGLPRTRTTPVHEVVRLGYVSRVITRVVRRFQRNHSQRMNEIVQSRKLPVARRVVRLLSERWSAAGSEVHRGRLAAHRRWPGSATTHGCAAAVLVNQIALVGSDDAGRSEPA